MTATVGRLILTNQYALLAKYHGSSAVQDAINNLSWANIAGPPGLILLLNIDDAQAMQQFDAPVVTNPSNEQQNKNTIDALYDYFLKSNGGEIGPHIMLVGGPDIIPHQTLNNPMVDGDKNVPSDLPYASNSPYSVNPSDFADFSRVVTRIPDVTGLNDPTYFVNIINNTIATKAVSRKSIKGYFALSSAEWKDQTTQDVTGVFGNANNLSFVPPKKPPYSSAQYSQLLHYINCHGNSNDPSWYGAPPNYPVAFSSSDLAQHKLTVGTVSSIACCYGAQLYNPSQAGIAPPLCNTYLLNGAVAFLGSTNISYAPIGGSLYSDLMTTSFIANILRGQSIGQALFNARTSLLDGHGVNDPYTLKTLCQFMAFGYSSLVIVNSQQVMLEAQAQRLGRSIEEVSYNFHWEQHARNSQIAEELSRKPAITTPAKTVRPSQETLQTLTHLAQQTGLQDTKLTSYVATCGRDQIVRHYGGNVTIHIMSGKLPSGSVIERYKVYMAYEVNGRPATIRELESN